MISIYQELSVSQYSYSELSGFELIEYELFFVKLIKALIMSTVMLLLLLVNFEINEQNIEQKNLSPNFVCVSLLRFEKN